MKRSKAEIEFEQWMGARGVFCHPSAPLDNMNRHFDFITDNGLVEVKDRKKINRTDEGCWDERKLVEWQAVHSPKGERNRRGWVRGSAHWIVFKEQNGWLWVRRSELEALVSSVDWTTFTQGNYAENFKAFRRVITDIDGSIEDRDDLFCYVPRASLMALQSTKFLSA